MLSLQCPKCRKPWVFPEIHAGKMVACSACGTTFVIQSPGAQDRQPIDDPFESLDDVIPPQLAPSTQRPSVAARRGTRSTTQTSNPWSKLLALPSEMKLLIGASLAGGALILGLMAAILYRGPDRPVAAHPSPLASQAAPPPVSPSIPISPPLAAPVSRVAPRPPPPVVPPPVPPTPVAGVPHPPSVPARVAPPSVVQLQEGDPPAPTEPQDPDPSKLHIFDLRPYDRGSIEDRIPAEALVRFDPELAELLTPRPRPEWKLITRWIGRAGNGIGGVAVSADGKRVLAGRSDGVVTVWDVDAGKPVAECENPPPGGHPVLALSADGKLAAGGNLSGGVQVWDADTGKVLFTHTAPAKRVISISLSDDGAWVVIVEADGTLYRFPARGGEGSTSPGKYGESRLVFGGADPRSEYVFTADPQHGEGLVVRFHKEPGKSAHWPLPNRGTLATAGSIFGPRVLLACEDHRLIDVQIQENQRVSQPYYLPLLRPEYAIHSHDGKWLWIVGWNEVELRNVDVLEAPCTLPLPVENPLCKAAAPGARLLACGQTDGALTLWRLSMQPQTVQARFTLAGRRLLADKNYDRIDEIALQLRGVSEEIYEVWMNILDGTSTSELEGPLKQWVNERPASVTARLTTANALIRRAWLARGSGFASTVTKEGRKIFDTDINRARTLLMPLFEGKQLPPRQAYRHLFVIGKAQGWDRERLEPYVVRLLKEYPDYIPAHQQLCDRWLVRWGGKPNDTHNYAVRVATSLGADAGEAVYAKLALGTGLYFAPANFEAESFFDLNRVAKGVKILGQAPHDNLHEISRALRLYHTLGRKDDARVFGELAASCLPEWDTSVWPNRARYLEVLAATRAGEQTPLPPLVQPQPVPPAREPLLRDKGPIPWAKRTPAQNAEAVEDLKIERQAISDKFPALMHFETEHFLFSTDIPRAQMQPYVDKLDAMYDWLCKLYGMDTTSQVFHGKAQIVAFSKKVDFFRFERVMMKGDGKNAQGICHQFPDGRVLVSCFLGADLTYFSHMLVHETSHAFAYRFLTDADLPSWINEGLAEYLGGVIVPEADSPRAREELAVMQLRANPSLRGMLHKNNRLTTVEYGAALSITRFLMEHDSKAYAAFFEGVKRGDDWEVSLKKHYQWGPNEFVAAYGKSIGAPKLRP